VWQFCVHAPHRNMSVFIWTCRYFINVLESSPSPYLRLATSEIWCWSGGRRILNKTVSVLQYRIVYYHIGAQKYEQFLEVGRLYRALISFDLALSLRSTSVSSVFMVLHIGCFKKSSPPKTFWNIFTSVNSFCVKFCEFVGNSYPHISTYFCRFILIFHQMALIFPRVPIVFTMSSFE